MTNLYERVKGILVELKLAAVLTAALLLSFAPAAQAQTEKDKATGSQGETAIAGGVAAAVEPLLREYKGVALGMSAGDVRAKLGKPEEKSEAMDFYVFSDKERARVYYLDGKASAIIATYVGKSSDAPTPLAVLGTDIEAKPDGSLYKMVKYPQAGYWVAYSRVPGDSPLVMVTMQKMN
jgi:hypothetical protein